MPPFIDLKPIEKAVPTIQCSPGGPGVPLLECYTIANIVSLIFKFVIALSAAIFLVLLLYGGFVYLTAGGTDENVEKAKKIMTQALIGLVIVASAYGVGIWTLKALGISTQITGSATTNSSTPTGKLSYAITISGTDNKPVPAKVQILIDGNLKAETDSQGKVTGHLTVDSAGSYSIQAIPPIPAYRQCRSDNVSLAKSGTIKIMVPTAASAKIDCSVEVITSTSATTGSKQTD